VDSDEITHAPISIVPSKFSNTWGIKLDGNDTTRPAYNNVLTCNPHNCPKILSCEHTLQDSSHKGELYDTAQGSEHERSANVELKRLRDYRIKCDEGEAKADVGPAEVRNWVIRYRIHVCLDYDFWLETGGREACGG
jgi:hypothetical protein